MKTIIVVNLSKRVIAADVQAMILAGQSQMAHAAALWQKTPLPLAALDPKAKTQTIPPDAWPIFIVDVPDDPGALGYHSETSAGKVFARVFVNPILDHGGTVLGDPANVDNYSVSATFSHELLEMLMDPLADFWADGHGGKSYALEACDAVENDSYLVHVTTPTGKVLAVAMSNYILPSWFDQAATPGSQYDFLGKLKAPFTMTPGGYLIVRKAGAVSQVFGERYPEWKKVGKTSALSRTGRRSGVVAPVRPVPTPSVRPAPVPVAVSRPAKAAPSVAPRAPKVPRATPPRAPRPSAPGPKPIPEILKAPAVTGPKPLPTRRFK